MKTIYTPNQILATAALLVATICLPIVTTSQTYVAKASGDWSNPKIWGEQHPDSNLCEKTVIIPKGKWVNLDKEIDLDERVELVVKGKLKSEERVLDLSNIQLIGDGKILASEIHADETTVYGFEGLVYVDKAKFFDGDYSIPSTFVVEDELILMNALVDLNQGKLKLKKRSKLMMGSSEIDTTEGKLIAGNHIKLYYIGDGGFAGPEATLRGVESINISLDDENASIVLANNQELKADVVINVGELDINGFALTTYNDLVCAENGYIRGDQNSDLLVGGNSNLVFADNKGVLNTFKVGAKETEVEIHSPLLVTDLADLSYGKLDMNKNVMTVAGQLYKSDFVKIKGKDSKWVKVVEELPVEDFLSGAVATTQ